MPATLQTFEIDDAKTFEENFDAFMEALSTTDPELAAALKAERAQLLAGQVQASDIWNVLQDALEDEQS